MNSKWLINLGSYQPRLRLFLLQVLQISLQAVVRLRLCFQVGINLTDLLRDDVRDVAQRLLDRVFRHVPLEASNVLRQVG